MKDRTVEVKNGKIVKFNCLLDNRINLFGTIPDNKLRKVVIYCHDLGSDKNLVNRFSRDLLNNNIGVVSFDFPRHGDDKTPFSFFNLSLCIEYMEEVIKYIKDKYNVPICLFGSSFGGFVILNRLIRRNNDIDKTILMLMNLCHYIIILKYIKIVI